MRTRFLGTEIAGGAQVPNWIWERRTEHIPFSTIFPWLACGQWFSVEEARWAESPAAQPLLWDLGGHSRSRHRWATSGRQAIALHT